MTVSVKVEAMLMGTVLAMPAKKRPVPITESRKVERKHLTPDEVDRLIDGAKRSSRYPARDALLLLMAYRHGFRATELVSLRWSQVDLKAAKLHVQRLKQGTPSTHPLGTKELRALAALRKAQPSAEYIFLSERGTPMSADNLRKLVTRSSEAAGLDIKARPRQRWTRYATDSGLPRTRQHPTHGRLHSPRVQQVQRSLEGLSNANEADSSPASPACGSQQGQRQAHRFVCATNAALPD
jgi:type 1 fimbriae regulatory protein FimB/type 1 fimbriae regulatory protein FimE